MKFRDNIFLGDYREDTVRRYPEQTEWVIKDKYDHVLSSLEAAQSLLASLDYKNPNSFRFKYHMGQSVWMILKREHPLYTDCLSCSAGKILLKDGADVPCPNCKGRGVLIERHVQKWVSAGPHTIGQLRLEYSVGKLVEQYMCEETGIGQGYIHDVLILFPNQEEASAECEKRNGLDPHFVCEECLLDRGEKPRRNSVSQWLDCSKHGHRAHSFFQKVQ